MTCTVYHGMTLGRRFFCVLSCLLACDVMLLQVAHIEAALAAERAASGAAASSSDTQTYSSSSAPGGCNVAELLPSLACKLVQLGYGVSVRWSAAAAQQHSSLPAGEAAKQQRHCFLRVTQPGEDAYPLIVDPAFREQFKVSPSTARQVAKLEVVGLPAVVKALQHCSSRVAMRQTEFRCLPPPHWY